jgi:hypothetical protein
VQQFCFDRLTGFLASGCPPFWHRHCASRVCAGKLHGDDTRTGQSAKPHKLARPRRCHNVYPRNLSGLEPAVALFAGYSPRNPVSISCLRTHSFRVC